MDFSEVAHDLRALIEYNADVLDYLVAREINYNLLRDALKEAYDAGCLDTQTEWENK